MDVRARGVGVWVSLLLVWPGVWAGGDEGEPEAVATDLPPEQVFERQWQAATVDELVLGLNRLAEQASRTEQELAQRRVALDGAWMDPANRSPEVDALRERLQELEAEMLKTRAQLREAVAQLEAVREQREALRRDAEAVERIKLERRVVQRLLQARLGRE